MKTFKDHRERQEQVMKNLGVILPYWMCQLHDDSRPAEVVVATCELNWPGRSFYIPGVDEDGYREEDGEELFTLHDAVDRKSGKTVLELLEKQEASHASGDC